MKNIFNITIIILIHALNVNGQVTKGDKLLGNGDQKGGNVTNQTRPGATSQKIQVKFYTTSEFNARKDSYKSSKTVDEVKKDSKFLKLSLQERQYAIDGALKPQSAQKTIVKNGSEYKNFEKTKGGVTYKFTRNKSDEIYNKKESDSVDVDEQPNKATRICKSIDVDLLTSSPESILLDNRATIAYPLSIMDINSLLDGSYKPMIINGKQNKMTITIDGIVGANNVTYDLDPGAKGYISRSDYATALNTLRNQYFEEQAVVNSTTEYELIEISDINELKAKLDLSFGEEGDEIYAKTNNSASSQNIRHTIIAKSIQKMYSVGVGSQDINYFYNPDVVKPSEATVVTNVNYGIMKYIKFDTDLSLDSLKAALNGKYNNVSGNVSLEINKKLENTKIKVITIGVGADNVPKEMNLSQLTEYLGKSETFSKTTAGVPISWSFSFLNDGTSAYCEIISKFKYRECQVVAPKKIRFDLTGLKPTKSNFDLCGKIVAKVIINNEEMQNTDGKKILLDCDCNDKSKWIKNLKKEQIEPFTNNFVEYTFSKKDLEKDPQLFLTFDIGDGLQDFENAFDVTGRKAIMYNLDDMTKVHKINVRSTFPIKYDPSAITTPENQQADPLIKENKKLLKLTAGRDKVYIKGDLSVSFLNP